METTDNERFIELDACRGLASMTVALAHLLLHYDLIFGFASDSFEAARLGDTVFLISRMPVYFFFMISGFVIGLTVLKSQSIGQFAVYRFARLFPTYWAAVLLTSALLFIAPHVGRTPLVSEIAINLTMIPRLVDARLIDPVYWSLAYELVFYFMVAAFFCIIDATQQHLAWFATLLLCASALYFAVMPAVEIHEIAMHGLKYAPFFTGGIGFFLWRHGLRNLLTIGLISMSAVVSATRIGDGGFHPASLFLFMSFFVVISGAAPILRWRPFIYLGRISYPLYLFHLAPGFFVISALDRLGAPIWLSVSAALASVIGLAHMLHTWIESPSRQLVRSFYQSYLTSRVVGKRQGLLDRV